MMVDTVRPVGHVSSGPKSGGGCAAAADDGKPLSNPRRVYSDLGFRNNLMDLMAGRAENDEDETTNSKLHRRSRLKNEGSSFRSVLGGNTFQRNHSVG